MWRARAVSALAGLRQGAVRVVVIVKLQVPSTPVPLKVNRTVVSSIFVAPSAHEYPSQLAAVVAVQVGVVDGLSVQAQPVSQVLDAMAPSSVSMCWSTAKPAQAGSVLDESTTKFPTYCPGDTEQLGAPASDEPHTQMP